MTFTDRAAHLIKNNGIPLESIVADSLSIEPHGSGFILKWAGALILTEDETAAIIRPRPSADDIAAEIREALKVWIADPRNADIAALAAAVKPPEKATKRAPRPTPKGGPVDSGAVKD